MVYNDADVRALLDRIALAKSNPSLGFGTRVGADGEMDAWRDIEYPSLGAYRMGEPGNGDWRFQNSDYNIQEQGGVYSLYKSLGDGAEGAAYADMPRDNYSLSGDYLGSDQFQAASEFGDGQVLPLVLAAAGAMFGAGALANGWLFGSGAAGAGSAAEAIPGFTWEGLASGVPETFGGLGAGMPELAAAGATAAVPAAAGSGASAIPNLLNGPPVAPGMGAPHTLGSLATAATQALGNGGGAQSLLGPAGSLLGPAGSLLGPLATAAGGLLGSQGEETNTSEEKNLPGFLQGPVAGQLVPGAMSLLDAQRQAAADQGVSMIGQGASLMHTPVARNGVGQVQMHTPSDSPNPYQQSMLDELQRRSGDLIGQHINQIAGRQVAAGGMGSTRQGVAQGQAISQGQDQFLGHAANLMGGLYESDMGRAMQRYGIDNQMYDSQRKTDLAQVGLGSGLLSQGFDQQWAPYKNATSVLQPFTGYGTATQSQQQGGGMTGALGGALGAAQWAKNMGLFGGESGGGGQKSPGWW